MAVSFSGLRSSSTGIGVAQGGTGNNTLESGSLLVGNGTNPIGTVPVGSEGQVLTVVNGEWAAANNAGGGGGGGLSSITTSGNLQGNGTAGSPATLKANISLTSVTASLKGDGSQITGLTAGQISGIISSVSSSGNLEGDGTSGSPITLKSNISLTSVTASFNGSGAGLSGLGSSQISDFNSSVDARITNIPNAALQNSSITINGTVVSLGGNTTITVDPAKVTFTGSGFAVGNAVALSGTYVVADYSDSLKSNVIGVVSEISGTSITIKTYGEETATSASLVTFAGTPVYVGPSGSVVQYSGIPSGKYATQVGFVSPTSGKIFIQPRVFGQIA